MAATAPVPAPGAPTPSKLSGHVHYQWSNGDVFDGQMADGKRNGKGRFAWASGQIYDGDWHDDIAEGVGAMVFVNGDRYQGQVKDGTPNGVGKMQFANGESYEGVFESGILEGEGVYVEKDGSRYSGRMKAGIKQGRGKIVWASGQVYEGDWVADKPEGSGTLTFANGDRYEGPMSNGVPQGKGVKTYASEDRYEGSFAQGDAQGEGSYRWKNGDAYTGHWEKGKKSGTGVYRWAGGTWWEGEFADDKRTEVGSLHFTPTVEASGAEGAKIAVQAEALAASPESSAGVGGARVTRTSAVAVDRGKLLAIPMVAKELRDCSRKHGDDCAGRVVDNVMGANLQQHRWQTMAAEKGAKGRSSVFEFDTNSVLEGGNVFSWLRSGDGTTARNIGIKYDCRAQTLEIQLIYQCTANQACVLDPNIDKYAGKVLPANEIKGWFKEACER